MMYLTISHGVHSRAEFISLRALEGVAFIRGRSLFHSEPSKVRRSFEGGIHSRAAFNRINTVICSLEHNCSTIKIRRDGEVVESSPTPPGWRIAMHYGNRN